MVYPKQNKLIKWMLQFYARRQVKSTFQELLFNTIPVDSDRAVLLLANHFSFWDALILYCVNDKLFKKDFYVMVNEATTYNLKWLVYSGAFSVNKNSRKMLESIDYAAQLLNNPKNLVLIFPQGKLHSNFVEDIHFDKGVTKITGKATGEFRVIFASTFIQYYKHKKQSVNVYLKNAPAGLAINNLGELKDAYQQHYDASKKIQTEIVL